MAEETAQPIELTKDGASVITFSERRAAQLERQGWTRVNEPAQASPEPPKAPAKRKRKRKAKG